MSPSTAESETIFAVGYGAGYRDGLRDSTQNNPDVFPTPSLAYQRWREEAQDLESPPERSQNT